MSKKILVYHWTAGANKPNNLDLNSYQLLIDSEGNIYKGTNPNPSSIAGLNTIAYNIALCGMCGYTSPKNIGKYPITQIQLERAWEKGARVIKALGISPKKIYTHSYIGQLFSEGKLCKELGIQKNQWLCNNKGKIDIDFLPTKPDLNREQILDLFRKKIVWYMSKIN